jgi:hypothetical protein
MTLWERVTEYFFNFFHRNIVDLSADKFTEGFGTGYAKAYNREEIMGKLEVIENRLDKLAERKEPQKWDGVDQNAIIDARQGRDGTLLVYIGGELIDKERLMQLKGELEAWRRTDLYRIMGETIKGKAIQKIVIESKSWEEDIAGKMMLHNLGIERSIMDTIEKAKIS